MVAGANPSLPHCSLTESLGKLTCRVACKPLLSVCSKVICWLSCPSRQSFREIAHILVHPYSVFSRSRARPLALYLLNLLFPFLSLAAHTTLTHVICIYSFTLFPYLHWAVSLSAAFECYRHNLLPLFYTFTAWHNCQPFYYLFADSFFLSPARV